MQRQLERREPLYGSVRCASVAMCCIATALPTVSGLNVFKIYPTIFERICGHSIVIDACKYRRLFLHIDRYSTAVDNCWCMLTKATATVVLATGRRSRASERCSAAAPSAPATGVTPVGDDAKRHCSESVLLTLLFSSFKYC